MDIEILHVQAGDKKKKIDTSTKEGKAAAAEFISIQIKKGTHLLLERGKKVYKITGYDPKTDSIYVIADNSRGEEKTVRASGRKSKVAAVPPIAGGAETIHVFFNGQVLCGFSLTMPVWWPKGHSWVGLSDAHKATCDRCLELATRRGSAA